MNSFQARRHTSVTPGYCRPHSASRSLSFCATTVPPAPSDEALSCDFASVYDTPPLSPLTGRRRMANVPEYRIECPPDDSQVYAWTSGLSSK